MYHANFTSILKVALQTHNMISAEARRFALLQANVWSNSLKSACYEELACGPDTAHGPKVVESYKVYRSQLRKVDFITIKLRS